MISKMRLIKR